MELYSGHSVLSDSSLWLGSQHLAREAVILSIEGANSLINVQDYYMPSNTTPFSMPRGPQAYKPIASSPHRSAIDRKLLVENRPVKEVWRWLNEQGVQSIGYVTLTRYKKAVLKARADAPSAMRRQEVRNDLATLGQIVGRGQDLLHQGLIPRLSDVLRAVELRSHILAQFPDATDERLKVARNMIETTFAIVLEVVNEEQRVEILNRMAVCEALRAPSPWAD